MKIKSVYISAFGKLKDVTFNFKDGLNLIYGENEKGKTTLMSFIKMMFYGCDNRSPDLRVNLRKKYMPLSGEQMAGSIIFEQNGNEYKIEKIFGLSSSTDKIVFTDLASGERKSLTGSKDLGVQLFGLTKSGFENCCYISSLNLGVTDQSGVPEINLKLSNLSTTGEEDISGKSATERLEKLKTYFRKARASTGTLDTDLKKLSDLKEQLLTADSNENLRASLNRKIESEKAELSTLEQKAVKIKEYLENAEKSKQRERLEEFLKADKELKILDAHLTGENGKIITNGFIESIEAEISQLKTLKEKLTETDNSLVSISTAVEELAKIVGDTSEYENGLNDRNLAQLQHEAEICRSDITQKNGELQSISEKINEFENKKPKINPVFASLFAIFSVLAVFAFAYLKNILLGGISSGPAVVFLLLSLLKKYDFKKSELPTLYKKRDEIFSSLTALNNKSSMLNEQISKLNEALIKAAENSGSRALLASKTAERDKLADYKKALTDDIQNKENGILSKFAPFKKLEKINQLQIVLLNYKDTLSKQAKTEMRFNMLKDDLGDISVGEATAAANALSVSIEDEQSYTKNDLERCNTRISELNSTLAFDLAKARTDFRFVKHPTSIRREIADLSEKIKREQLYYNATLLAITALAEASNEARKSFGGVLEKRVTEIFSKITNNNYKYVSVSKTMDLSVDSAESFGSIEAPYLSSGTADQAYFALRLALSEFLSDGKENLPLFLDDAFINFDDNRAKTAFDFLKEYAKKNQVFFFTCHNIFKAES